MTPRFVTKLQFEDDGGLPFTVLQTLTYLSDVRRLVDSYWTIDVPAGFKTDLASIPRGLWNVLPPVGRYDAAAVVHDLLYQRNGCTRAEADAVLLEAMGVLGVGRLARWTIYAGVRTGGWVVWNNYRKRGQ